ncbi:MAG: hypothetical protein AAF889_11320 [Cyanobacteria bacterium P01_D01_bin.73]
MWRFVGGRSPMFKDDFEPTEDRNLLGLPPGELGDQSQSKEDSSNSRFVHHSNIDPIHGELREMARCAAQFPPNHPRRRKLFNRMVELIQDSKKLKAKPEELSEEQYQEALSRTWLYFSRNICEPPLTAKKAYDPDGPASPLTWLNRYLEKRLQHDWKDDKQAKFKIAQPFLSDEGWVNPLDWVADAPDAAIALERLQKWVETDPDGQLSAIASKKRPKITALLVLRHYLPPEDLTLDAIADLHQVPEGTIRSFWTTKVKPLLLDFLANDSELFGG